MFNLERRNYKKNIRNLYYTMCDVCLCACVGVGVCLCVGMAERLTAIPPMLATVRERRLASDQESTNQPAHKRTWMGGDGVVRPNGGRTLPTRTPTIASIAPNTIAASMHPKRLTFIYIYMLIHMLEQHNHLRPNIWILGMCALYGGGEGGGGCGCLYWCYSQLHMWFYI